MAKVPVVVMFVATNTTRISPCGPFGETDEKNRNAGDAEDIVDWLQTPSGAEASKGIPNPSAVTKSESPDGDDRAALVASVVELYVRPPVRRGDADNAPGTGTHGALIEP